MFIAGWCNIQKQPGEPNGQHHQLDSCVLRSPQLRPLWGPRKFPEVLRISQRSPLNQIPEAGEAGPDAMATLRHRLGPSKPGGGTGVTSAPNDAADPRIGRPSGQQLFTLVLIAAILVCTLALHKPIGFMALSAGPMLAFVNIKIFKTFIGCVSWSTVLLVADATTYVSLLLQVGVIDTLAQMTLALGALLLIALVLCYAIRVGTAGRACYALSLPSPNPTFPPRAATPAPITATPKVAAIVTNLMVKALCSLSFSDSPITASRSKFRIENRSSLLRFSRSSSRLRVSR